MGTYLGSRLKATGLREKATCGQAWIDAYCDLLCLTDAGIVSAPLRYAILYEDLS